MVEAGAHQANLSAIDRINAAAPVEHTLVCSLSCLKN